MKTVSLLKELSCAHGMGGVSGAVDAVVSRLSGVCDVERVGNGLVATLAGDSAHTLMFDAHIDEIGFMVTAVLDNGFLKVAKSGGINVRTLAASEVVIHAKQDIPGVFATMPPHLKKEDAILDLGEMVVDTGYESPEGVVRVGDRVTFRRLPADLLNRCVSGKSLDNRAGCAALILTAERLAQSRPTVTVKFLFSDQEELGCVGAQTEAYRIHPDEAVAVDVSFGDGPDIAAEKSGKLFGGPMIGVSPVLSAAVTSRLKSAAKSGNIPFQVEVMGGKTSTNADVIALSGPGIPCGLVSIPLRNMHTAAEVVAAEDVEHVADLLYAYAMGGGIG